MEFRKTGPTRPIILTGGNEESPPSRVPLPTLVPWWFDPCSFFLHPRNPCNSLSNSVALDDLDHGSHGFQFQSFRFHDFKVSPSAPLREKWIDPAPEASRRDAEPQRFGTQRSFPRNRDQGRFLQSRKPASARPATTSPGSEASYISHQLQAPLQRFDGVKCKVCGFSGNRSRKPVTSSKREYPLWPRGQCECCSTNLRWTASAFAGSP